MTSFKEIRSEVKSLRKTNLLEIDSHQTLKNCIVNGGVPCKYFFTYKGYNFCVHELLNLNCEWEKTVISEQ